MRSSTDNDGRNHLKIKGFYVRLLISSNTCKSLPESITLVYLPRINASPLEIDGSKIRPDAAAFVTLHRVVLGDKMRTGRGAGGRFIFASREPVRASEGVRFEVLLGEEKVLKGIFRKDEGEQWKMECKCAVLAAAEVTKAEVCVAVEGHVAMSEKVEMAAVKNKKKKKRCFQGLEEIPEEREVEDGEEPADGCGGCCSCEEGEGRSGGGECEEEDDDGKIAEMEKKLEGVRWAVDVGVWVMCLGAGYFVSKSFSKSLRRLRIL